MIKQYNEEIKYTVIPEDDTPKVIENEPKTEVRRETIMQYSKDNTEVKIITREEVTNGEGN